MTANTGPVDKQWHGLEDLDWGEVLITLSSVPTPYPLYTHCFAVLFSLPISQIDLKNFYLEELWQLLMISTRCPVSLLLSVGITLSDQGTRPPWVPGRSTGRVTQDGSLWISQETHLNYREKGLHSTGLPTLNDESLKLLWVTVWK